MKSKKMYFEGEITRISKGVKNAVHTTIRSNRTIRVEMPPATRYASDYSLRLWSYKMGTPFKKGEKVRIIIEGQ